MTVTLYYLSCTIIAQIMGGFIRLYPLRERLRFSKYSIFVFYACLFLADALVYTQLFPRVPQLEMNAFRTVAEIVASLFAFLLLKGCAFQCLFLVCVSFMYGLLSGGLANFINIVALGHLQPPNSLWLEILVTAVCTYALLPVVLHLLRKLLSIWQDDHALCGKSFGFFRLYFFCSA